MDGQKLYHEFYKAFCLAYPEKDGKLCQIEANKKWKKLKEGGTNLCSVRESTNV